MANYQTVLHIKNPPTLYVWLVRVVAFFDYDLAVSILLHGIKYRIGNDPTWRNLV